MTRYADDFIIQCRSEEGARTALGEIEQWVKEAGLTLHPEKTRIVDAREPGGFDFLGYHFERGQKWPRKKSMAKLKDTIREKTGRSEGRSMREICKDLNRTLRGWLNNSNTATGIRSKEWTSMSVEGCEASSEGAME